jgi:hypothetical protein
MDLSGCDFIVVLKAEEDFEGKFRLELGEIRENN